MSLKHLFLCLMLLFGFQTLQADSLLSVSIKGAIGPPVVKLLENV